MTSDKESDASYHCILDETNSENSEIKRLHVFLFLFPPPHMSGLNCPACLQLQVSASGFFFMSLFVHSSHSHSVIIMHFVRWHPHVLLNMRFLIARSEKKQRHIHTEFIMIYTYFIPEIVISLRPTQELTAKFDNFALILSFMEENLNLIIIRIFKRVKLNRVI